MDARRTAAPGRRVALWDQWLVVAKDAETSVGRHVYEDRSFELTGVLHDKFWSNSDEFRAVGRVVGAFRDLAEAKKVEAPTMRDLLAPNGFGRLFLELTGRCNENCRHCYASSSPTVDAALSWEKIEETLEQAKLLGFSSVQLTGGDPLVSKHISQAAEKAYSLQFGLIEVYTNGLALSPELAALFASLRVKMAFSVYSHRPEIHDEVTQTRDSHTRTLRAIRLAVEHKIPVRVSVVLSDSNQGDTAAVRAMVESLGVPPEQVACDRERPVGRGTWRPESPIPESETPMSHALPAQQSPPGLTKLAVTYNGDVVPCIFDRRLLIGSIRGATLSEVLSAPLIPPEQWTEGGEAVGEPLACSDCSARHSALERVSWKRVGEHLSSIRIR